jgi:hypothetical protein
MQKRLIKRQDTQHIRPLCQQWPQPGMFFTNAAITAPGIKAETTILNQVTAYAVIRACTIQVCEYGRAGLWCDSG